MQVSELLNLVYFALGVNFIILLITLCQNLFRNIFYFYKKSLAKRFNLIIEAAIIENKRLKFQDFRLRFWQTEILIELLFDYKNKISGQFALDVDSLLAELGYLEIIRNKLKKSRRLKLIAIQKLGFWQRIESGELLRKFLKSSDVAIRKEAIRSLASIQYVRALPEIFKYYPNELDYSLLAALAAFGKALKPYLGKYARKTSLANSGLSLLKGAK